jgi:hypothetical protein
MAVLIKPGFQLAHALFQADHLILKRQEHVDQNIGIGSNNRFKFGASENVTRSHAVRNNKAAAKKFSRKAE